MTRSIAGAVMPSSSPRSLGEGSHHDTPSTNLTAYSPDDVANVIAGRLKICVIPAHGDDTIGSEDGTLSDHDPFTVQTPVGRSALSPNASSFTPGQGNVSKTAHEAVLTASGRKCTTSGENPPGEAVHGRARHSHGAIAKPSPPRGLANGHGPVSRGSTLAPYYDGHYRFSSVSEGIFTSDEAAQRAIKVSGDFVSGSVGHLQNRFNTDNYPSCCGILLRNHLGGEFLYVQFSDVRDAVKAYEDVRMGHWQVGFLNPKHLGFEITGDPSANGPLHTISNFEGQLKAQVLFNPQNPALTAQFVISLIKKNLEKYGEVKAIHSTLCGLPHVKTYCIEFYDTR